MDGTEHKESGIFAVDMPHEIPLFFLMRFEMLMVCNFSSWFSLLYLFPLLIFD